MQSVSKNRKHCPFEVISEAFRFRWGELLRKMHLWVEILEINDQGVYAPVELHLQKDNLTGGVFQLRQGHSRRMMVQVQPIPRAGSLPVVCNMISAVYIGSVCMRTKNQQPLDSYQEKDLSMWVGKYIPLTNRVRGPYCMLLTYFVPVERGHKSTGKTRTCNLQYGPRKRG